MGSIRASSSNKVKPARGHACGICGGVAAEIKSHIIPFCEQKRLKDGEEKYVVVVPHGRRQVSESGNRFWQRGLLCQPCEDRCSHLDHFWARFSDQRGAFVRNAKSAIPWTLPDIDAAKLTTFLVSVLLRAHATDQPEFRDVDLGKAFPDAVKALSSGGPSAVGFRLIAQIPQSAVVGPGFRALAHLSPSRTAALLWFGMFRFIVGFPSARWDSKLKRLTRHKEKGGLLVSTIPLETLPEYKGFERMLPSQRAKGDTKRGK